MTWHGALLRQVLPDGSVYSAFDGYGRPTDVITPGVDGGTDRHAAISYTNLGDTWTFDDRTTLLHDPHGELVPRDPHRRICFQRL